MKLHFKFPHLSFRTITSVLFLMVILAELWITFTYLYRNLKSEPAPVNTEKIIQADLKGYSQIYNDLTSRDTYAPQEFNYVNANPFKFGQ
jgi:hypothetical protein